MWTIEISDENKDLERSVDENSSLYKSKQAALKMMIPTSKINID